ncbi:GTPase IMAP family member 8-like [Megalops cyprinoides]|uniref:GTPase IMAP family member 8-like n=1 Tax=Megalops cyprinoides TaxID=118141 RepID=UPI00186473E9|nr:GTPase IMAP family member 8-like [Megalops cyprinoides]
MATDDPVLKHEGTHSRELRIVLLGGRWGGKSSAGNTILGTEWFDFGRQRTVQSENRHKEIAGRQVTVVDTPGWKGYCSLKETTAKDKEEIKHSVCHCLPGPHAFLLIVPLDTSFTEDHRTALVEHLKLLGDRVWRYSMVLFTCGDWLKDRTIEEHIETEGKALQWLVDKCRNRYHVFNNRNRGDDTQVTELLEKIQEMVAENGGGHYEVEESVCQAMEEKRKAVEEKAEKRKMEVKKQREELKALIQEMQIKLTEMRVVLLGSQNAGKSATGNTILGKEEFDVERGTLKSFVKHGQVNGMEITIVDTPGWWRSFSVNSTPELIKHEVQCSVFLCPPGPHVFLLVIDTDVLFTERQRRAVEEHLQLLGGQVWRYTMVLFTKADWLRTMSIEQYIELEGQALQWLVEKCGNKYHALDNKNKADGTQVTELLQKIEEMVAGNRGSHYQVDEKLLGSIEEKRKEVKEKAKQRMKKMKEQRKRLQAGLQGSSHRLPELRLVLLGQEGAGKNATGSTILGREVFPTCETAQCEERQLEVAGRPVKVVNTPGWSNNLIQCTMERDKVIMRSMSLCPPGPHAVLLVIPADIAYTERHWRALLDYLLCLGENVWRHTMVLFSYGDRLADRTIEEHIEREGWFLQWLVDECGNRYHVFNNKDRGDGTQVKQLLEKIEEMVAENSGHHFSPDMSQVNQKVEEKFQRRMADEIRLHFEEQWRRREGDLMTKFKKSLMELGKEIEGSELPAKLRSKHNITPPL